MPTTNCYEKADGVLFQRSDGLKGDEEPSPYGINYKRQKNLY